MIIEDIRVIIELSGSASRFHECDFLYNGEQCYLVT